MPTIDLAQIRDLLALYPLAEGVESTYEVTITYATSVEQDQMLYDVWHGIVHEKVVRQRATDNGVIFDLYYPDYPDVYTFPFGKSHHIGEYTESLRFQGNTVYNQYDEIVFIFPLEVNKEWLAFGPESPPYTWKVVDRGDFISPAGKLTDCYYVTLNTGPDSSEKLFCNGVGVVWKYGWHHPATWLYEWELVTTP